MLVVGIIVLLVGLIGAGALWYGGGQRLDENVAGFARAPSGCATTLDFERSGEFTVYIESTGEIDELAGDCIQSGTYDRDGVPDVEVTIVDPEGQAVDLATATGVDYDTGSFVGTSLGTIEIDAAGDYVVTVPTDGAAFAVSVGGDPGVGVAPMRWGAAVLAIVGLVVGGILLVLGSRRRPDGEPDATLLQAAPAGWPTSPPGFPAPPPTTGAVSPGGLNGPPALPQAPPAPSPPAASGWGPPTPGTG